MRNVKRFLAGALVGISVIATTATAFAAGSITGIVENGKVDVSNATIDGEELDTNLDYELIITNTFSASFYETEEGEALIENEITPLNEGTTTLSETITAYDASDTATKFDLSNYEMLTPIFNVYVQDSNGVIYDGLENVTVSFDVNTYSGQAVKLMYFDRVLGDWVVISDFTIDGQTFSVTLPMVATAITVIYDASVESAPTGAVTESQAPIYFAFGILIIAGAALLIVRRKYAQAE